MWTHKLSLDGTVSSFPRLTSAEHPRGLRGFPYLVLHSPIQADLFGPKNRLDLCFPVGALGSVLSGEGERPEDSGDLRSCSVRFYKELKEKNSNSCPLKHGMKKKHIY